MNQTMLDYETCLVDLPIQQKSDFQNAYYSCNTILTNKKMTREQMRIKIMFIGDSGVGKTALLTRWHEDIFSTNYPATIGIEYKIRTYHIGNLSPKVHFQDTKGQERLRSTPKLLYRDSHVVCLCFSLNDRTSFLNLLHWLDQVKTCSVQAQVYLFGCKSDMERTVQIHQILAFAATHNLPYFQTAAKYNTGVDDAFRNIVKEAVQANIMRMEFNATKQTAKVKVETTNNKRKGGREQLNCIGC